MRMHIYGMNDHISVFDFSGIYNDESFYQHDKSSPFCIINCRDISGTNCMCDDDAIMRIKEKIKENAIRIAGDKCDSDCEEVFAKGIHFIDSGNYHYMSALITDMIKDPFSLVVLDHHPDMQPPMFGDILSCGGWVLKVIENNPYVKDIHVIGADRGLIEKLDKKDAERVNFYDVSEVRDKLPETQYPVFLSIYNQRVCYNGIACRVVEHYNIIKFNLAESFCTLIWPLGVIKITLATTWKSILCEWHGKWSHGFAWSISHFAYI